MSKHVLNLLKYVVIEKTFLNDLIKIYGLILENINPQLDQVAFDNMTH